MNATKKTPKHRREHPDIYVPDIVDEMVEAGLLEDTSWHNDASASFEGYGKHRREAYRLWLDARDLKDREMGGPRVAVVPLAWAGIDTGGEHVWEPTEDGPVFTSECVAAGLDWMMRFVVGVARGDRVRFKAQLDIYPFTVVKAGSTGTVMYINRHVVAIRLDHYDDNLDEWDNEAHLQLDAASPDEDAAEFVLSYVEVIPRA